MAAPAEAPRPLVIYVGDDLSYTVTNQTKAGVAIPIGGRTYALKVRPTAGSTTVLATATCTVVGDGSTGVVTVTIAKAITAALTPQAAVADLEETNGAAVTTLIRWPVSIVQDVTR